MTEFRMPSLGADMEAGKLTRWKIKPGDRVKRGDIVAEVETEKADIDVEIFTSGIVHELLAQPGEKLPVGTVLATILEEGETPAAAPPSRPRVSPLARKLAAELGVDLALVHGTGPDGAITREDIERARPLPPGEGGQRPGEGTSQPPPPSAAEPPSAITGMRRAIAAAMARSNREIPHYYLETPIDMHRALDWLQNENLKRSVEKRLLPAVLLIRAVTRALKDVPELNGYWVEDHLEVKDAVNVGFAIALRQGGLITPAILEANHKDLDQLMAALSDLIARAREGHLRSSEIAEGTITITSLGDLGVETVFGVIYPPQVALVGFGRIQERPWAVDGMLGVRPVLTATLAGDHRATDGRRGAQFLSTLDRCLQEPEKL
jgi:pyruvate dehydrogenase E2 component (dihydrolipoamide acetyltransferase)